MKGREGREGKGQGWEGVEGGFMCVIEKRSTGIGMYRYSTVVYGSAIALH